MTTASRRTDTTGNRRGKRGKVAISLPTQSLADTVLYQDVPVRTDGPTLKLPAFGTAHPRSSAHKLIAMEPFQGDDNLVYVRETYRKLPGLPIKTVNAIDQAALGGETETVTQTVGVDASEPTGGFDVLEATKQQIDGVTAVIVTKKADQPYPMLLGSTVDPQTGIVVQQQKTIVAAGTAGGVSDGWHTEIQPYDKYRSISIASKVA